MDRKGKERASEVVIKRKETRGEKGRGEKQWTGKHGREGKDIRKQPGIV